MKYLVIGGNAAGMSFAAKLKRNEPSSEIVVIEKLDYVSFGACGLPYYVGNRFENINRMIVRKPEKFIEQNIDLRINQEVISINYNTKEVVINKDGKEYLENYDRLIISTGARPIILPVKGENYKNVFTLTTKNDGEKLKDYIQKNENKQIAILGAGFIGLEVMDEIKNTNNNFHVVTRTKHILDGQYSDELIQDVEDEIKKTQNIDLLTEREILSIEYFDKKYIITLSEGTIEVDAVIMSLGFRPNTAFIENIDKLPNGAIITNKNAETSQKNVYAIGDCATVYNKILGKAVYMPLATVANKSGKMLAEKLSGHNPKFSGMLGSTCIKLMDYEMARVGLTGREIDQNNLDIKETYIEDFNQTSYYPGQSKLKIKIYYQAKTLEVVGAEIIGKHGVVGRIGALAVAIDQKVTTEELAYIDFPYSPPFSRTWDALNTVGNLSK